ncbi:hypothetical protein P692DRAFT_201802942 [Suillus brevipes Sb2]|nr:hypothetical protein P692DRAFT_201802942 [Suillus brevipes Sb2]
MMQSKFKNEVWGLGLLRRTGKWKRGNEVSHRRDCRDSHLAENDTMLLDLEGESEQDGVIDQTVSERHLGAMTRLTSAKVLLAPNCSTVHQKPSTPSVLKQLNAHHATQTAPE